MTKEQLQKIVDAVASEWGMSFGGIYDDLAIEVAERALRAAAEPSDEQEIPMGSRVRHLWQQWDGEVVAIDTKYEIQRTDGTHAFAWHRELERLPERTNEGV